MIFLALDSGTSNPADLFPKTADLEPVRMKRADLLFFRPKSTARKIIAFSGSPFSIQPRMPLLDLGWELLWPPEFLRPQCLADYPDHFRGIDLCSL